MNVQIQEKSDNIKNSSSTLIKAIRILLLFDFVRIT